MRKSNPFLNGGKYERKTKNNLPKTKIQKRLFEDHGYPKRSR